jgi:hypothetical protein
VYRCIDDLMRMRSALPISTPVPGPVAAPPTNVVPPPVTSASTSDRTIDDIAAAAATPIPDSPATETPNAADA